MKERQLKAFDFASETTKLLITLCTGIIALTITFSKDFIGDIIFIPIWPLVTAWILYFLSVIFGIFTMQSLTGHLDPKRREVKGNKDSKENAAEIVEENAENTTSIYAFNITLASSIQIGLFLLALIFTGVFGYQALVAKVNDNQMKKDNVIEQNKINGTKSCGMS